MSTLAGAPPLTAGGLGLSMLALQVSIGALNDWADAPLDAVSKRQKPIPAGLTSRRAALVIAVAGLLAGLGLSLASGRAVALVALIGVGLGYAYDLGLSRTALSWLPLALALPLSPIHAWLGATGGVPPGLLFLVPVALLAGVLLALANGLVDLERDRASGKAGIVLRLGRETAWRGNLVASAVLAGLVVLLIPSIPLGGYQAGPGSNGPVLSVVQRGGVLGGLALVGLGNLLLRGRSPGLRERGWELQAIGVGGVGIAWIAGVAAGLGVLR
jgi:4-hydroxybenzoate polyprenyltransferase